MSSTPINAANRTFVCFLWGGRHARTDYRSSEENRRKRGPGVWVSGGTRKSSWDPNAQKSGGPGLESRMPE